MGKERMRSPLGRALGLGSARDGFDQWWRERVTALALVPLTVWLAVSLVVHMNSDYARTITWLRTPLAATLIVRLLTALFWHMALGLQVVIEDYVHSGLKLPLLIAMRFSCKALGVAGILAVLRICFRG